MNIFTNMLFLQGYLSDPRWADDADAVDYSQGYGNHVASAKAFAPLGHGHAIKDDAHHASRRTATFANDPCPTGACG
jgi:hypothetical protein